MLLAQNWTFLNLVRRLGLSKAHFRFWGTHLSFNKGFFSDWHNLMHVFRDSSSLLNRLIIWLLHKGISQMVLIVPSTLNFLSLLDNRRGRWLSCKRFWSIYTTLAPWSRWLLPYFLFTFICSFWGGWTSRIVRLWSNYSWYTSRRSSRGSFVWRNRSYHLSLAWIFSLPLFYMVSLGLVWYPSCSPLTSGPLWSLLFALHCDDFLARSFVIFLRLLRGNQWPAQIDRLRRGDSWSFLGQRRFLLRPRSLTLALARSLTGV